MYERFRICEKNGFEAIFDNCDDNDEPLALSDVVKYMNEMDNHFFNQPKFAELSIVLGILIGIMISYVVWFL